MSEEVREILNRIRKAVNKKAPFPKDVVRYSTNYSLWAEQQRWYDKGYNDGVMAAKSQVAQELVRIAESQTP